MGSSGIWPCGLWYLAAWPLGSRRMALSHLCSLWVGFGENRSSRPVPNPPVPGALNVSKIERDMDHIGALSGLKATAASVAKRAGGIWIQPRLGVGLCPPPTAAYVIEDRHTAPL